MRTLRLLFHNLDHLRPQFYLLATIGFLDGIATFFFPLVIAEFSKQHLTWENFKLATTILALTFGISIALQWFIRRYGEALAPRFASHLRLKYFRAASHLPVTTLTEQHSGYLLSLINRVCDGIGGIVTEIIWGFAKSVSNMILFFIFTARESLMVACVNFVLLTLFIALSTALSQRMVPLAAELNLRGAAFSGRYSDLLMNIGTVRRLGLRAFGEQTLQRVLGPFLNQVQSVQLFHANRWFVLHTLFGMSFILTVSTMLWLTMTGQSSPSVLILFVGVYSIVRNHIERLSEDFKWLLEMNAYIASLETIVSPDPHTENGSFADWTEIALRDVHYRHPGSGQQITIPEFNLRRGEILAVDGASGQGKTTFLNLLSGFLTPDSGLRSINGEPVTSEKYHSLQSDIAFVSQEVELFNMSVRDNLTLGAIRDDAELTRLLEKFGLGHWFSSLEQGFDQELGERGLRVSAGQKQRLNLIRGLLLNRPILILDEPTAHLDRETERLVVSALRQELYGKTVIIVTHRQALLELASSSYTMENHELKRAS